MQFRNFVKANFLGGLLGTLVLSPVAYLIELVQFGVGSKLLKLDFVDVAMLIVVPFFVGIAFAVSALVAFPILKWLQKKGVVRFE